MFSRKIECSLKRQDVLQKDRLFSRKIECSLKRQDVLQKDRLFSRKIGCSAERVFRRKNVQKTGCSVER